MSSSFTPRKEFIRRLPLPAPDSFALLALSGSNCIRLYSFPASIVDALRRLFEQLSILLSSREDSPQCLCEFALDGKPWAKAKAVSTEKLLLDIMAIMFQYGYNYLSTIDYGRESDDRLAMVFSKPAPSSLNSQTTNPLPLSNSTSSLNDKEAVQRVPFALSFASTTLMRVIAPPLHLTPAILQAVRASWPRGVVSEKKVGDNSFEFRLKGYKWFQQDTFATDSLRHILALLTSLNSHSFSLLTSISLTNRSKVKDLWIFTGPAPERTLPAETSEDSLRNAALSLQGLSTQASHPTDVPQQHKRFGSEPPAHPPSPQHLRFTTDKPLHPVSQLPQPHLLQKPAPRAQVPISVFRDSNILDEHHEVIRAHMPSVISVGVENMTGVGTSGLKQDVLSTSSPLDTLKALQVGSERLATPPLLTSASDSPKKIPQENAKNDMLIPSTNDFSSPPLLEMDTFRVSASPSNAMTPFSRNGSYEKDAKLEQERPRLNPSHSSNGSMFPGGWQSTPVVKKPEDTEFSTSMSEEKGTASTPIHEKYCRIEAPAIIAPDMTLRKSEAALVGIIASTSHVPSIPQGDKVGMQSSGGGQGWVLVNVEGSNTARPVLVSESTGPSDAITSLPHGSNSSLSTSPPSVSRSLGPEQQSPSAKAIVIIDAMDSKQKKRSITQNKERGEGGTSLKQFFSLNKKDLMRKGGEESGS